MPRTHVSSTIPQRILLPVDFSPSSHAALKAAAELAAHFGARIHLVHVIPAFPTMTFADFIPETDFLDKLRTDAGLAFTACQTDLASKGINVTTSIEVGSDVAGTILDITEREHIDMLVISTHGIAGWYPMVFGSVAEKIVKLAQCPVLLLRTPKPESSVKVSSGRSMEWW